MISLRPSYQRSPGTTRWAVAGWLIWRAVSAGGLT